MTQPDNTLPDRMAALAGRLEDAARVSVDPVAKTWLRAAEAIRDVLDGATA